jgi:hypothetical protein
MPENPDSRRRRVRLADLVADPRLMDTLTTDEKMGLAAEIYLQELVAEDARAKRPNMDALLSDTRKFDVYSAFEKMELAVEAYINKRVQAGREPFPDPGTPPVGLPPAIPNIVAPLNASISQDNAAQTLAWTAPGAVTFDVRFGSSGTPPVVSTDQSAVTYDVTSLSYDTVYYWRVIAKNEHGSTEGPLWSFRTKVQTPVDPDPDPPPPPDPDPPPVGQPPTKALLVSPASPGNNISRTPTLSWTGNGTSYGVRFGTSNPPPLVTTQAGTEYLPATLPYATTYYWRIDSINANGTTVGDVWSFTTLAEPLPTGVERVVLGGANAAANLQAALDAAQPGDILRLEAGQTFVGNFRLPNKNTTSTNYITVTSTSPLTAPYNSERMNPTTAALFNLPKIQSPNATASIFPDQYTHHWKFVGLEFLAGLGSFPGNGQALALGDHSTAQNSLAVVPHHMNVERCYIHGTDATGLKRGIAANGAYMEIKQCHISNCWYPGVDSQAIGCWNSPGPMLVEDCFLEAGSENIMVGGSDPSIAQLVMSDITILRCHFYKPLSWIGDSGKVVKNLLEFKSGRNILVEFNLFENNWVAAQAGSALLWKTVNQDGAHTQNIVENILFQNNVVRNVSACFNFLATQLGRTGLPEPLPARNFDIINNLFYKIDWLDGKGGNGRFMQTVGIDGVNLIKNTVFHTGDIMVTADYWTPNPAQTNTNWTVRGNNFHDVPTTGLGWKGASRTQGYGLGGTDPTAGTFQQFFPGIDFNNNLLADFLTGTYYGAGNYYPANIAAVQYTNLADPGANAGQGSLIQVGSPWKGLDADNPGEDTGCDYTQLAPAFAAVKPW